MTRLSKSVLMTQGGQIKSLNVSLIMNFYAQCHLALGTERQHRKVYVVGGGAMSLKREMELLSSDHLVSNICWRSPSTIMNYN